MYHYSNLGEDTILVMDLFGPNLEDLMKQTKTKRFSLKTVLMIADQFVYIYIWFICIELTRLNNLHDKEYIHRDLKPENCVIGLGKDENTLYLIDFGLSRRYKDPKTKEHIPYKDGKSI